MDEIIMIEYQEFNSNKRDYHDIKLWFNFTYPPHLHKSMELIFLIESAVSITVEGKKEEMRAGQLALIFSNQIHSFNNIDHSVAYVHVFSPDVIEQFTRLVGSRSGVNSVFTCDEETRRYILSRVEKLIAGTDMRNRRENSYDVSLYNSSNLSPQMLAATSYLYAACDQYMKRVPLTNVIVQDNNISHKIMFYITEHFTENITLKDVSEALGYEPHYLSSCFNKMIGTNFRQSLNIYRVNYAKHLLSDPQKSITEIAMQCGFQSIRNFNRCFKNIEGKTPKAYRSIL